MIITKIISASQVVLPAMLFFLYPALAFSTEYYVDGTTGNDANVGSASAPWKTIGHAIEMAEGTDIISVQYATYQESLELKSTQTSSLIIKGISQNGNMPIIDANGNSRAFDLNDFNGTLQGLEIKGATIGINIGGESKYAQVIGCDIHENTKGIHVNNTSAPLISGNVIYSNSECGIATMGESSATIDGNQIYNNGNGSNVGPSAGICIPGDSTPKIYNNIIRNNYNTGIIIRDNAIPVIVNNTIAHHRGSHSSPGKAVKIVQNSGIDVVKITNNIIFDNDYGLFSAAGIPVTGNTHNAFWQNNTNHFGFSVDSQEIFTAPLLADDYSLNSNSPCIDTGTFENTPKIDIAGIVRPQGTGSDMGAYEYQEKDQNPPNSPPSSDQQQGSRSILFLLPCWILQK